MFTLPQIAIVRNRNRSLEFSSANVFPLCLIEPNPRKLSLSIQITVKNETPHHFLLCGLRCAPIHRVSRRKMNNSIVNKSFFLLRKRPQRSALFPNAQLEFPLQYKVFSPCKAQTFISPGERFIAYRNSLGIKRFQEERWKKTVEMVKINGEKLFIQKIYYTILGIAFACSL